MVREVIKEDLDASKTGYICPKWTRTGSFPKEYVKKAATEQWKSVRLDGL